MPGTLPHEQRNDVTSSSVGHEAVGEPQASTIPTVVNPPDLSRQASASSLLSGSTLASAADSWASTETVVNRPGQGRGNGNVNAGGIRVVPAVVVDQPAATYLQSRVRRQPGRDPLRPTVAQGEPGQPGPQADRQPERTAIGSPSVAQAAALLPAATSSTPRLRERGSVDNLRALADSHGRSGSQQRRRSQGGGGGAR